MSSRTSQSGTRRMLSLAAIVLGALLLLVMPLTLFYFALSHTDNAHLPGTLVILTSIGGIALVGIGAALRE